MELRDYARAVRDRWILVVVIAALGLAGGFGFIAASSKSYQAQTKSFVTVTHSANATIYSDLQFTLSRMKSYTELANTNLVLQPVIDQLNLPMTVSQLASHVSVTNPSLTVVLDVVVTDGNPDRAASIANAVADSMSRVIEGLEGPAPNAKAQVLTVTVTKRATPNKTPVSPRRSLDLALGLLIGLAVGLAIAILRQQSDSRVESAVDIDDASGLQTLGVIPSVRRFAKRPIAAYSSTGAIAAEAFHSVRARLTIMRGGGPHRILVASASAEEGRSLVACNIAVAAAQAGKRVCLFDADLRNPRIAQYLGLSGTADVSVAADRSGEDGLLIKTYSWHDGLVDVVIPDVANQSPSVLIASGGIHRVLDELDQRYELLVVDSPPISVVADALVLAKACDGVLLVARHGRTAESRFIDAADSLTRSEATIFGALLNDVPRRRVPGHGLREWRRTRRAKALAAPKPARRVEIPKAVRGEASAEESRDTVAKRT